MVNNDEKDEKEAPKDFDEFSEREACLAWLLDPDTSIAEIIFDFD